MRCRVGFAVGEQNQAAAAVAEPVCGLQGQPRIAGVKDHEEQVALGCPAGGVGQGAAQVVDDPDGVQQVAELQAEEVRQAE